MRIHFTMVKPEPESGRKSKPNGKGHMFEEVPENYLEWMDMRLYSHTTFHISV